MQLPARGTPSKRTPIALGEYGLVAVGVVAISILINFIPGANDVSNIAMLYLLAVIGAAYRFGRGPAVLASFLAVLSFDWFVQKPRYSLSVENPADWLELITMLVTAMVISQLTTMLRQRAWEAYQSEREAAALSEISWAVASQVRHDLALAEVLRRLVEMVPCTAAAILAQGPNQNLEVIAIGGQKAALPDFDSAMARATVAWVYREGRRFENGSLENLEQGELAAGEFPESSQNGYGSDPSELANAVYLPLSMEHRVLGVLFLRLHAEHSISNEQRRIVESLVNYATVALERQRLTRIEAQTRALSEADRLKTALLSMVSHDFRSPLSSIKASVTGLLQEGVPWERNAQRELLNGINQETDRLNRMVGNILALSRLETGDWRPQCELVPLDEVIGAALDGFSAEDDRRIRIAIDPALVEVWVDSVQIVQVLHNLLENALKYSPPATSVELQARQEQDNLIIEVSDEGEGLSSEEKAHVFERFYRSPRWRESSLPGTGIGLAICSGLVEAHHGQLTVDNRPGGGAVFRMTLPLRPPEDKV